MTAELATEIKVDIYIGYWAAFYGTRAQLEAEGLVPEGMAFPERTSSTFHRTDLYRYELRRSREGRKNGPWAAIDRWRLVICMNRDNGDTHRSRWRSAWWTYPVVGLDPRVTALHAATAVARADGRFQALMGRLLG